MTAGWLTPLLRALGAVATGVGVHDLARGTARISGRVAGPPADVASVDSELRFGSAWYAAAGLLMLGAAADPDAHRRTVSVIAGGWAMAATGRLLSWRAKGRPRPVFVALTAAEIALPGILAAGLRAGRD